MKAIILAGGDVHFTQRLKDQLTNVDTDIDIVIAADSGIRHAKALSLIPNLLVGDFDSISNADLKHYATIPTIKHQPEKDDLDLELAIQEAQKRGASALILVGATGSRLDQSLAAIMIAARHKATFQSVQLLTGKQDIEILQTDDVRQLSDSEHRTFSLLSLIPESIISIKDAKYPLDRTSLAFGTGLGVSNEKLAFETTEITIHSGLCILIIELENT